MSKDSTIEERARATKNDPRWMSIINRDASGDGKFYYSVKTTGVYCRPSCAARLARPENVLYHLTCEDAEKAGFRPCKRLRMTTSCCFNGSFANASASFAISSLLAAF